MRSVAPSASLGEERVRHEVLQAVLLDVGGTAEVKRAGTNTWVTLRIGDAIRQGDAVRTSEDGSVELGIGEARLHLREGSSMGFAILAAKRVKVTVRGLLEARSSAQPLELASAGTDVVAQLTNGEVSLFSDDQGRSSLATAKGEATLSAGGKEQQLGAGQYSLVGRSGAPSRPASVPQRLSLQVQWPPNDATNKSVYELRGSASAARTVLVQGHRVHASAGGAFVAQVNLRRGRQRVTVEVADVLGHRKTQVRQIVMDPDAPTIRARVLYR